MYSVHTLHIFLAVHSNITSTCAKIFRAKKFTVLPRPLKFSHLCHGYSTCIGDRCSRVDVGAVDRLPQILNMKYKYNGFSLSPGVKQISWHCPLTLCREARQMEENSLHNQHNVVNFLLQHAKLAQHITNIRQEEKAGRYFLCGLVLGMIKEHFSALLERKWSRAGIPSYYTNSFVILHENRAWTNEKNHEPIRAVSRNPLCLTDSFSISLLWLSVVKTTLPGDGKFDWRKEPF